MILPVSSWSSLPFNRGETGSSFGGAGAAQFARHRSRKRHRHGPTLQRYHGLGHADARPFRHDDIAIQVYAAATFMQLVDLDDARLTAP